MAEKFTQSFIDRIAEQKDGYYSDSKSEGLCIRKRGPHCSFFYRRQIDGKRKEIGLGSVRKVSLIAARAEAARLRAMSNREILELLDRTPKKKEVRPLLFREIVEQYEAWNLEVGNWQELDKAHRLFRSRMKNHVLPVLGEKVVEEVTCEDVAQIASNLWNHPDTVERVIQLVKRIFDWAKAKSLFNHDNPADRTGALKYLLPTERHIPKNRGALSVEELPLFMKALYDNLGESNANRCAFFAVLTATRSQTAREAKWSQIDFEKRVWDIPPSQLKMSDNGALIVPLADEVLEFLRRLNREDGQDLIFPNPKGAVMTDTMFSSVVRRLPGQWLDKEQSRKLEREVTATMHGIARATFRTWSQYDVFENDKRFDARVAELCLHHKVKDLYNGAYERNQSFIRRRELMSEWARYCFSAIKQC